VASSFQTWSLRDDSLNQNERSMCHVNDENLSGVGDESGVGVDIAGDVDGPTQRRSSGARWLVVAFICDHRSCHES